MTLKTNVEQYLRTQPLFRERKNKDMGIVNLLINRHFKLGEVIRTGMLSKGQLKDIVQEYASMDRAWRQALEQDPNLRGKDYGDKAKLEQTAQVALGYTPGYDSDVRKLKSL